MENNTLSDVITTEVVANADLMGFGNENFIVCLKELWNCEQSTVRRFSVKSCIK